MLKRWSKNSDIIVELDMDLSSVSQLEIEYFTDGNYTYRALLKDIDITAGRLYIYIPSVELAKMEAGQLKSTIRYRLLNTKFIDSFYDNIITQNFNVWIE